jgi:hypothetical protein
MCNWCKAKDEIHNILKKYKLKARILEDDLECWGCEGCNKPKEYECEECRLFRETKERKIEKYGKNIWNDITE